MKNSPLVSWILATHNNESTIEKCIFTLFNQTYKNFELIIINDYSTDMTKEVLKKIRDKFHNKIKIYENDMVLGLAASLNKAISLSNGEYLARIDADDYVVNHRLEYQVKYLNDNPDISVVGSNAFLVNKNIITGKTQLNSKKNKLIKSFKYHYPLSIIHPSTLIRRTFFNDVGVYDERLPRAQDQDLWIRGMKLGKKFYILDQNLIYYNKSNYSLLKTFLIFKCCIWISIKNNCFGDLFLWNLISLFVNIYR
tara:strand:+ start:55 stop:813 length:759 start_codon:yes stop_codon:yes gene_type:complete